MKPLQLLLVALAIVLTQSPPSATIAAAAPFDGNPKILLHLRATTTKNQCASAALTDCRTVVTEGSIGQPYFAYIVAARGNLESVAGLQAGIHYQNECATSIEDGTHVDIFAWTNCATREFATQDPPWPRSGSGNRIFWDAITRCQTGDVAIAGYFYMTCYGSPDNLQIVPSPSDGLAKLVTCSAEETFLPRSSLGNVQFSTTAAMPGCNPCNAPCTPPACVLGCPPPPYPPPPPPPPLDTIPPARVTSIEILGLTTSSIRIGWQMTGDDGHVGQASAIDIRYSTEVITPDNFHFGATPSPSPLVGLPGGYQRYTLQGLASNTTYFIALKVLDEVLNASELSIVAGAATLPAPGSDGVPPAPVTDLVATALGVTKIQLNWTAPGDDGQGGGPAQAYDVRYSTTPINATTFSTAMQAVGEPTPTQPGTPQSFVVDHLTPSTSYYFVLKSRDEVPRISGISNSAFATTAAGAANSEAAMLLHVQAPSTSSSRCGQSVLDDCRNAVTSGGLLPARHFVYVIAGAFSKIAGMQFGITYDDGEASGCRDYNKLDVLSWTLCADAEFVSQGPTWPAPGSGNLLTWHQGDCQAGPTAVAGFFYVGAYGADTMAITPHPADGTATVSDCASVETPVLPSRLGSARFSSGGAQPGFNPCDQAETIAIQSTTWSRIKTLVLPAAGSRGTH